MDDRINSGGETYLRGESVTAGLKQLINDAFDEDASLSLGGMCLPGVELCSVSVFISTPAFRQSE